jgi:hypothetical protein
VAALAVAFRSYVTSLKKTKTQEACGRVTEIFFRWQKAVQYLGPMIEIVPQLLIISIFLFAAGLIDSLFAISTQLDGNASIAMFLSASLCSFIFAVVILILFGTTIHSVLQPHSSPFPSKIARIISGIHSHARRYTTQIVAVFARRPVPSGDSEHSLQTLDFGIAYWKGGINPSATRRVSPMAPSNSSADNLSVISSSTLGVYHRIMSQTYDDELLDDASSALANILRRYSFTPDARTIMMDSDQSRESVIGLLKYLLSPRASRRSLLTAAVAICHFGELF